MKTNSRKRLLVSSVAMLLVAMLALGTATYAWFTSNTTATANGLNVKTSKTSTLEISKSDHEWGTSVDYAHTQSMYPASTANGTAFFKTVAAAKTAFDRDETQPIESASGGTYVFAEQLNVKNSGEGTVKDITITINNFTCKYGRIALVPATEAGAISYPEGKSFVNYVYDTDGKAYDALNATTGTTTAITPDNSMTIDVPDLGTNKAAYYNLYVWFEGQDAQCFDTNAGQNLGTMTGNTSNFSFTVTGTPESTPAP